MDMAIICKDAAREYIKVDKNFEIIGTLVQNSDVFLTRSAKPSKIGITQNRAYQNGLITSSYPEAEAVELLGSALPYALTSKQVDAVVIDAVKTIGLAGNVKEYKLQEPVDTYVLIVDKKFKKTQAYETFVEFYNQSAEALQDKNELIKTIETYKKRDLTNKEMEMVNKWKLKLLPIK
ncbi:MAG: ABC transporter substrate-binding (seleno)protein SaoB [Proteocatella sp.]